MTLLILNDTPIRSNASSQYASVGPSKKPIENSLAQSALNRIDGDQLASARIRRVSFAGPTSVAVAIWGSGAPTNLAWSNWGNRLPGPAGHRGV